ncbi:uncharacterized protein LOC121720139 [Alosa sapidissima]|uniref:uncharacterized protein LOC121720139 n=1 Tax=Alosa sapidissima TaxID=34773 RepID=UPI001C08968B|nr:uncharacterized protein LOC121720139 [Alosa sapidissima]XP_041961990.1 uncharacterized protein LOC121720139 [Alosa sapidissima]
MKTLVVWTLFLLLSLTGIAALDDQNSMPCMLSDHTTAYKTFLKRHILEGAPSTDDQNAWEELLRNKKFCSRPTQSFLPESERQRVEAVCSPSGGKAFRGNMCISKEPFSFITVRVEQGTCGIKRIVHERKHLILACEKLQNVCQPVHFEGNPQSLVPDQNKPDCGLRSPRSGGDRVAAGLVNILCLLLVALEVAV